MCMQCFDTQMHFGRLSTKNKYEKFILPSQGFNSRHNKAQEVKIAIGTT